ncbi:hypothetical protein ACWCXH_22665 [Kitasatospora sp. NPDC001660]
MREIAEEWGGPIAVVRNAPPEWRVTLGSGSSDGFLCHLDVNYHQDRELVAIVQSSRLVPASHRVRPVSTPESQLWTFLADSGRIEPTSADFGMPTAYIGRDIHFNGLRFPVHVHQAHGCSSTLIPQLPDRERYIIVTAPDEHWATVTDLVLCPPESL